MPKFHKLLSSNSQLGSGAAARAVGALCLATSLALSGCASPTPYQPASAASAASGGYSESMIAPGLWRVSFKGNSLTSRERVEKYLLYRAAELTQAQGYSWFRILNRETEHSVREEVRPDPIYDPWWTSHYWYPQWRYYHRPFGWRTWDPFWGDPFIDTREIERYMASAEIEMYEASPVGDSNRNWFSAMEVMDRIGPSIERP